MFRQFTRLQLKFLGLGFHNDLNEFIQVLTYFTITTGIVNTFMLKKYSY